MFRSKAFGQVFEMGLVWIREFALLGFALYRGTVDFLEKHDVSPGFRDALAHGVEHEATISRAIALVNVISQNVDLAAHGTPFLWCLINLR